MGEDICFWCDKPNGWIIHIWLGEKFCSHDCVKEGQKAAAEADKPGDIAAIPGLAV